MRFSKDKRRAYNGRMRNVNILIPRLNIKTSPFSQDYHSACTYFPRTTLSFNSTERCPHNRSRGEVLLISNQEAKLKCGGYTIGWDI